MYRDHTKVIQIGNKKIGGGNPILIQSMTNTKTEDVQATVAADPCPGGCRLRYYPLCSADYGSGKGSERDQKTNPHSAGGRYSF